MTYKKPPPLDTTLGTSVNDAEIARLEREFAPKRPVPRSLKEIEKDKKKKK